MEPPRKKYGDWCEKHWKVILDEKLNGVAASLSVVNEVLADERFMRMCGWDPKTGARADVKLINEAKAKHSPLCCFLGDGKMKVIYDNLRKKV